MRFQIYNVACYRENLMNAFRSYLRGDSNE